MIGSLTSSTGNSDILKSEDSCFQESLPHGTSEKNREGKHTHKTSCRITGVKGYDNNLDRSHDHSHKYRPKLSLPQSSTFMMRQSSPITGVAAFS